ncbi:MAG: hypothetical protein U0R52_00620 [Solirubrobacterales bacterium]
MARSAPGRARLLAGALLACLLAGALAIALPGDAGSAPLRKIVLGKTSGAPKPDCPGTPEHQCQAVGRVTGFQSIAGDSVKPFEAPFDGKIVAWSISLSRPSKSTKNGKANEQAFFNDFFDKPSQARLAILKRVPRAKPAQYKLVRQSPVEILNPYFGRTVTFALDHPLNVVLGQMVGLTIPTWAPAFFHAPSCEFVSSGVVRDQAACNRANSSMAWRASRQKGRCEFNATSDKKLHEQVDHSFPQQKVGSTKQYYCYYRGASLLYTATLIKKPRGS